MKIYSLFLAVLLLGAFSCSAPKTVSSTQVTTKPEKKEVGVFKFGYISHEIIDSSMMKPEVAEMMVSMVKPAMENEVVFCDNLVATLMFDPEGNMVSRMVYDASTSKTYDFRYSPDKNSYFEMDLKSMMKQIPTTPEDQEFLDKSFKVEPDNKKEIHGFECEKVTMYNPENLEEVIFEAYTTDKVPYMTAAMGPMGSKLKGLPLESSMNMQGLKMTSGVISYGLDETKRVHLQIDTTNFVKLTEDEYGQLMGN